MRYIFLAVGVVAGLLYTNALEDLGGLMSSAHLNGYTLAKDALTLVTLGSQIELLIAVFCGAIAPGLVLACLALASQGAGAWGKLLAMILLVLAIYIVVSEQSVATFILAALLLLGGTLAWAAGKIAESVISFAVGFFGAAATLLAVKGQDGALLGWAKQLGDTFGAEALWPFLLIALTVAPLVGAIVGPKFEDERN